MDKDSEEGLDEITIEYPNELYITVIASASNTAAGNFKLEMSFNDRDVDTVLEGMTELEKAEYFDRLTVLDTEVTEDYRFWVILASAILGSILVLCLLYFLCKRQAANEEIIAEVEVMDADGL